MEKIIKLILKYGTNVLIVIQLILIILKLTNIIEANWWYVMAPTMGYLAFMCGLFAHVGYEFLTNFKIKK